MRMASLLTLGCTACTLSLHAPNTLTTRNIRTHPWESTFLNRFLAGFRPPGSELRFWALALPGFPPPLQHHSTHRLWNRQYVGYIDNKLSLPSNCQLTVSTLLPGSTAQHVQRMASRMDGKVSVQGLGVHVPYMCWYGEVPAGCWRWRPPGEGGSEPEELPCAYPPRCPAAAPFPLHAIDVRHFETANI